MNIHVQNRQHTQADKMAKAMKDQNKTNMKTNEDISTRAMKNRIANKNVHFFLRKKIAMK
jgi:hypothetical protein